jgi:hypothetical protein
MERRISRIFFRAVQELVCEMKDQVGLGDSGLPGFRNAGHTIMRAGELAVDCAGGVGIVPKVHGQEEVIAKGV